MKKLFFILLVFSICSVFGQEKYSPTLIVLNSQETIIAPELDSIAQTYIVDKPSSAVKKRIRRENGPKFRIKSKKEIEFLKNSDISSNISYGINFYLSFEIFEYFENLMIYPAKEKNNSSLTELNQISKKHDVNWIVNLKRVEFLVQDGEKIGKVAFQLYNQKTNQIVIEEHIIVDDHNPGFTFACKTGTVECVINNAISSIASKVLIFMGKDKKYWR